MAETDPSLMAGFPAGTIESWRKSVDKVLAGALVTAIPPG